MTKEKAAAREQLDEVRDSLTALEIMSDSLGAGNGYDSFQLGNALHKIFFTMREDLSKTEALILAIPESPAESPERPKQAHDKQ